MSILKSTKMRRGLYTIRKLLFDLYLFEIRLSIFGIFHSLSWSIWLIRMTYDLILTILI